MKKFLLFAMSCLSFLSVSCQNVDSTDNKKAAEQVGPNPVPTAKLDRVGH